MALMNCPECNGQISSSALTCPHCGYQIIPTFASEFNKAWANPKPMSKPKTGFGFSGILAVCFLIVGLTAICNALFGGTTYEKTGEEVITRGWLRAAIEKKPEYEVHDVRTPRPMDEGERAMAAISGICFIAIGAAILHYKYGRRPKDGAEITRTP